VDGLSRQLSSVYCPTPRPFHLALLRDFTLTQFSTESSRKVIAIAY
jgi:hypothetical protein